VFSYVWQNILKIYISGSKLSIFYLDCYLNQNRHLNKKYFTFFRELFVRELFSVKNIWYFTTQNSEDSILKIYISGSKLSIFYLDCYLNQNRHLNKKYFTFFRELFVREFFSVKNIWYFITPNSEDPIGIMHYKKCIYELKVFLRTSWIGG
jgi:hypothetical protein